MKRNRWEELTQLTYEPQSQRTQTNNKELYPALSYLLDEVRKEISNVALDQEDPLKSSELITLIERHSNKLSLDLSTIERDQVLAILEQEQQSFGIIQSLIDTVDVTDIIITNYRHITVQQGRRTSPTDIKFSSQSSYENFVERLLSRAGTSYSTKKPIADGMVGHQVRLHAVHKSVCETGPYLTLRINRYQEVAVDELAEMGFCPSYIEQFLGDLAQRGHTFLIVGEVGTGKTTLARALAAQIPQEESILVIEDTPEIRLSHPNVRYLRTREANAEGEGRIAPASCIRAGMRMAMNRIIFGEIRDAEAAEAFIDVCSSGHPGISTFHARSAAEAVTRLELLLGRSQPGVGRDMLLNQIGTAIEVLIHVGVCTATRARRIFEVREISGFADGVVRYRDIFKYQHMNETPTWKLVSRSTAFKSDDGTNPLQNCPPHLTLAGTSRRGHPQ